MTNAEIIALFRAEIERRIEAHHSHEHFCAEHEFRDVLSFVSDLEKSLPEKVADDKVLEVEAVSYCFDNGLNISPRVATDFARHFYGLGCYHTAEKYDEIEYNRQRAEESEKPMNLEEEINRYLREECSDDDEPGIHEIAEHFAQWGAEHLKR